MGKRGAAVVAGVVVVIVAGLCLGLPRLAKKLVADEIRWMAEETPWIEGIEYESLQVALLAPRIRLRNISIGLISPGAMWGPARAEIDELDLYDFKLKTGFPDTLRILGKGARLPSIQGLPRRLRAGLEAMKYEYIEADFEYGHAFNRERREMVVDGARITAKGMGGLSATLRLLNIDPEKLMAGAPDKGVMLMMLAGVSTAGGEIRYTDESLVGGLWKTEAREWLLAVDRAARKALRDLDKGIERGKKPSTRQAWRVMADFLENPGEIRVTAAPTSPIPFLRFAWIKTPDDLMDLLGVSMENSKGK